MHEIDQRDRELLGALQGEVPLVSTPYAIVGQQIDMSEKEVIKRIDRLRRDGVIKALAAHFDLRGLGYRSSLVAARVTPERIDEAAGVISSHPGVTQNYRRNNTFNLWFTVAVPPHSKLGLEKTIEILAGEAQCEAVRPLPTIKLYKSATADGTDAHTGESELSHDHPPLTEKDIECVRLLQRELPLQPRPFDALARTGGIGGDELLDSALRFLKNGQMRRYSPVLVQRKGFVATAMGVWAVPPEAVDEYGAQLSLNRAVSHCYLRPTYSDWPYNIYTTVQGRSVDECESIINDLAADSGLSTREALFPTREYKKARINVFGPEADEWEAAYVARRAAAAS